MVRISVPMTSMFGARPEPCKILVRPLIYEQDEMDDLASTVAGFGERIPIEAAPAAGWCVDEQ